jgi:hypothetical protein
MESPTLPASDSELARLLVYWGHRLDSQQRVLLTKLDPAGRGEVDRVVKYPMGELRRLVGSEATAAELRDMLNAHFEPPARA